MKFNLLSATLALVASVATLVQVRLEQSVDEAIVAAIYGIGLLTAEAT